MKNLAKTSSILLLVAATGGLHAHHSSAPHFDQDTIVDVVGSFTELKYVNPHAYIYFDVEQDGETANWRCELSSATQLTRNGWDPEMFEIGEEIAVNGAAARREDNVCFVNYLVREDGMKISRNEDITELRAASLANAVEAAEVVTEPREKYLENGQPNLGGPWVSLSFGRGGQGIRANFVSTAAGEAASEGYEMAFDDPILRCHYVNLMGGWNHDTNINDIYQTDETITIQYGFMDVVRTVHMGMSEHPADIVPSSTGHSIGSWDGDTLVVDTYGFEEGILNHRSGQKHSDQMRVVERFHVDEESQTLIRDYTVTDPLYLVGETTGQDIQALSSTGYKPYNCVELSGDNNIRPEEQTSMPAVEQNTPATSAPAAQPEAEKTWWKFWE